MDFQQLQAKLGVKNVRFSSKLSIALEYVDSHTEQYNEVGVIWAKDRNYFYSSSRIFSKLLKIPRTSVNTNFRRSGFFIQPHNIDMLPDVFNKNDIYDIQKEWFFRTSNGFFKNMHATQQQLPVSLEEEESPQEEDGISVKDIFQQLCKLSSVQSTIPLYLNFKAMIGIQEDEKNVSTSKLSLFYKRFGPPEIAFYHLEEVTKIATGNRHFWSESWFIPFPDRVSEKPNYYITISDINPEKWVFVSGDTRRIFHIDKNGHFVLDENDVFLGESFGSVIKKLTFSFEEVFDENCPIEMSAAYFDQICCISNDKSF